VKSGPPRVVRAPLRAQRRTVAQVQATVLGEASSSTSFSSTRPSAQRSTITAPGPSPSSAVSLASESLGGRRTRRKDVRWAVATCSASADRAHRAQTQAPQCNLPTACALGYELL